MAEDNVELPIQLTIVSPTRGTTKVFSDKKAPRRSQVWNYFTNIAGTPKAHCKLCGRCYSKAGGTSNLFDHLKRVHSLALEACALKGFKGVSPGPGPSRRPSEVTPVSPYTPVSDEQIQIDKLLVKFIAKDMQPISIVDDVGFKDFVNALNPRYSMPCQQIVSHVLLNSLYNDVREKLQTELRKVKTVALTADYWSSFRQEEYITLTAHYVTDDQFMSACLNSAALGCNHTAENVSSCIKTIIDSWELTNKISVIVTNNAPNMIAAVKKLNLRHLGCVAQTINLLVNEVVENSPELGTIICRCSAMVSFFKQCTVANENLKTVVEIGKPMRSLQQAGPGWNSKYKMMNSLLELKDELVLVMLETPNAPEALSDAEWLVLEEAEKALAPFHSMAAILTKESWINASQIIPLIHGLVIKLTTLAGQVVQTNIGHSFVTNLLNLVTARLSSYESVPISRAATFLDPRFKSAGFMSTSRADEAAQQVENEVRNATRNFTPSTSSPSQSTSAGPSWAEDNLLGFLAEKVAEQRRSATSDASILIRQYLELPPQSQNTNVLQFWTETNSPLNDVAQSYLCVPATSVPAERIFSETGQTIDQRRNLLSPEDVNIVVFLNGNARLF